MSSIMLTMARAYTLTVLFFCIAYAEPIVDRQRQELPSASSSVERSGSQEKKEGVSAKVDEQEKKKMRKPMTSEDRLAAAAQCLGFSSLCVTSGYLVYLLLRNGWRALISNPYNDIPPGKNSEQKYLDQAWREAYFEKPFKITASVGLAATVFWAHYKFGFYKKAWENFRSLLPE